MALEYDFVENRFTPWDYVVFAILLVVSSVIGLYYGCTGNKQSSTEEFLMAGRSMGIFPVAMSMLASFMSAITLLGTPAEIAVFGTQYWMIWLSYCLVIPLSAHLFVPLFYRLNVTSVFEYLEMRFSKGVRVYASLVYIVQMMIYLALVLYAPCLALSVGKKPPSLPILVILSTASFMIYLVFLVLLYNHCCQPTCTVTTGAHYSELEG